MELLQKKDNRIGIIISVVIHHISILIFIFFSKGCMEIQNPPQFTLEEVIVIDFSDAGGGSPGNSSPQPIEETSTQSSEKEVTQEESTVTVSTNNSKVKSEEPAKEIKEESPEQLLKMILVIYLVRDNPIKKVNGEGEGTGIGTGKGPNTGGGVGDGKGRLVLGKPELSNPKRIGLVL